MFAFKHLHGMLFTYQIPRVSNVCSQTSPGLSYSSASNHKIYMLQIKGLSIPKLGSATFRLQAMEEPPRKVSFFPVVDGFHLVGLVTLHKLVEAGL